MNYFKGRQFQQDVIMVAVGYYLRYAVSYRDLVEMMHDLSAILPSCVGYITMGPSLDFCCVRSDIQLLKVGAWMRPISCQRQMALSISCY